MAGDDWLEDIELDMVGEHLRGAPRPSALRPSHSLPAIASSGGSPDAAGGGRGRPAAPHPHNHGGAASSRPGLQRMFAAISVRNSSKGAETPGTGEEADGEKIDDEEKNKLKAEVTKELKDATASSTAMKRPASVAKPKGKGKGKPKGSNEWWHSDSGFWFLFVCCRFPMAAPTMQVKEDEMSISLHFHGWSRARVGPMWKISYHMIVASLPTCFRLRGWWPASDQHMEIEAMREIKKNGL